jgi:hypothetical protein
MEKYRSSLCNTIREMGYLVIDPKHKEHEWGGIFSGLLQFEPKHTWRLFMAHLGELN